MVVVAFVHYKRMRKLLYLLPRQRHKANFTVIEFNCHNSAVCTSIRHQILQKCVAYVSANITTNYGQKSVSQCFSSAIDPLRGWLCPWTHWENSTPDLLLPIPVKFITSSTGAPNIFQSLCIRRHSLSHIQSE